jgi:hypothetical protein
MFLGRILISAMFLNLVLMSLIASFCERRQRKRTQNSEARPSAVSAADLLRYYLPRGWQIWLIFSTIAGVVLGIVLVLKANGKP